MNAERVYPGLEVIVTHYADKKRGRTMSLVNSDPNRWWVKYDDGSMVCAHVDNIEPGQITEIEILM
jgi:hypothetical protein